MPVLDVEKVEYKPPQEGEDYIVVLTEEQTAQTQDGETEKIQVAFEPLERKEDDKAIYNEGLWKTVRYTPTSKIGSFLDAFEGYFKDNKHPTVENPNYRNTDDWVGAIVRILSWAERKRKIQVRGYTPKKRVDALQKQIAERRPKEND